MDWAALIVGVLAAGGVAYTAWNARRTKHDEINATRAREDRPDWPTYAQELRQSVNEMRAELNTQDAKIDDLYRKLGEMRDDLHTEQRRSSRLLAYLRRVLVWASELSPEHRPPTPPPDLEDDLADLWRADDHTGR